MFLDVQVVFAIAFWGWITCDEFMHRLELSHIFVRNNVNSEAKCKISSENWKSCNYYKLLEQNEGNMGTKYNMNAFFSLKFSLIQRNWMSNCSSAYCHCKISFCKIMLLSFYLPYSSSLKMRWAFCPSIPSMCSERIVNWCRGWGNEMQCRWKIHISHRNQSPLLEISQAPSAFDF